MPRFVPRRVGEKRLRIAREKEFDVVLSDISMPEMDGFEFLEQAAPDSRQTGSTGRRVDRFWTT